MTLVNALYYSYYSSTVDYTGTGEPTSVLTTVFVLLEYTGILMARVHNSTAALRMTMCQTRLKQRDLLSWVKRGQKYTTHSGLDGVRRIGKIERLIEMRWRRWARRSRGWLEKWGLEDRGGVRLTFIPVITLKIRPSLQVPECVPKGAKEGFVSSGGCCSPCLMSRGRLSTRRQKGREKDCWRRLAAPTNASAKSKMCVRGKYECWAGWTEGTHR